MNIFEYATRNKLRFESEAGYLTVEQLWDLKLTSTRGVSLDSVGRGIRKKLREQEDESLVENTSTKASKELAIQFEIVKTIIATIQEEKREATKKAARQIEAARLREILAKKSEEKLDNMSEDEIKARLAELDSVI